LCFDRIQFAFARIIVAIFRLRRRSSLPQNLLLLYFFIFTKVEIFAMTAIIPLLIQPLLDAYLHALEPLRDHIYGIYIYGSIALGAFEEGESDIDIVALTQGEWTERELGQLARIHRRLVKEHPLGRCLEPMYVHLRDIGKFNADIPPYPYASDGKFYPAGYFDLNAVTWWTIKHKGISLFGPECSLLPLEVAWEDVLEAMRYNLDIYWAGKAKKPYLFLFDYWVMTAVATLCRILTAIEEGEIIAKSPALKRWRGRLPARWHTLIDEAWRIRQHLDTPSLYRSRITRMRETLAFIEYVRTLYRDFLS
jgi:predicted nucleotidyltransferase